MKKATALALTLVLTASLLAGCRRATQEETNMSTGNQTTPSTHNTTAATEPSMEVTMPSILDTMPEPNATDHDGILNDATGDSSILEDPTGDASRSRRHTNHRN